MSVPSMTQMANCTIDELFLEKVIIQVNDPSDHDAIDDLKSQLEDFTDASVSESYKAEDFVSQIKHLLDKVFYGLIGVTMFLCFFSLCASMSANLY